MSFRINLLLNNSTKQLEAQHKILKKRINSKLLIYLHPLLHIWQEEVTKWKEITMQPLYEMSSASHDSRIRWFLHDHLSAKLLWTRLRDLCAADGVGAVKRECLTFLLNLFESRANRNIVELSENRKKKETDQVTEELSSVHSSFPFKENSRMNK